MGVFSFPLLEFNSSPEKVEAKGDNREKEPFDPVPQKLDGGTVKFEAMTVDDGMRSFPAIKKTVGPRKTKSERKGHD